MSDAIEAAAKALISAQRDMFRGGGWFALDDAKTLVTAALTAYEAAKGGGGGNAKDEIVTRILDMALVGHALSDRTDSEADLFVDELRSLVTDVFVNNGLCAHPKPDGSPLPTPATVGVKPLGWKYLPALDVWRTPVMVTAWFPTPDELAAINAGAPIHLSIVGTGHPPVMMGVGDVPENDPSDA